jgi:uncharacterized protein (TIGR04255 family)
MAVQRHLPHAPISEAVIDLRVKCPPDVTFDAVARAFRDPPFGYQQKGFVVTGAWGISINPNADEIATPAHSTAKRIGLRLHSADEKYVALVSTEGFSLSRLEPYESWGQLVSEATKLWDAYRARLGPLAITRAATRYINDLRLPMKHGESFGKYVSTFVEIPPALPQGITSFVQRFVLLDEPSRARVVLSVAWDGVQRNDGRIALILDIDAQTEVDIDRMDDSIWTRLTQLRDLKNRCFFGSITEDCVELYL